MLTGHRLGFHPVVRHGIAFSHDGGSVSSGLALAGEMPYAANRSILWAPCHLT
jgi:hypothetical protein